MTFRSMPMLLLTASLLLVGGTALLGEASVPLITYGPDAPPEEGDDDSIQTIVLDLPTGLESAAFLRLFDADCGGRHDALTGDAACATRFTLVEVGLDTPIASPHLRPEDLPADRLLLRSATFARDPALDNEWSVFAEIDPAARTQETLPIAEGETVPSAEPATQPDPAAPVEAATEPSPPLARRFLLSVEGVEGSGGNVFEVALSARSDRNVAIAGSRVTSYSPTFRLAGRENVAEIAFDVAATTSRIEVFNFDVAGADLTLETAIRSYPLSASGQGASAMTEVSLQDDEMGGRAAIVLAAGGEDPNDVTFWLEAGGEALAVEIPPRLLFPNTRPAPEIAASPLADCRSVLFEASPAIDADGEPIRYDWSFGDDGRGEGSHQAHRYERPGVYSVRLRARDTSGHVGDGAVRDREVVLNQPPLAEAGPDRIVAPGESVRFDGGSSRDGDGAVIAYAWDFGDGGGGEGSEPSHAFLEPGLYTVGLRVLDDSGGPCDFATDTLTVHVNSPPVAEAGEDIVLAVGEAATFEGGRSYDTDGEMESWAWNFGDGASASGSRVEHAYSEPGRYVASLEVRDDAGVGNSVRTDQLTVTVNRPPQAVAGEDRRLAVGESTVFDAGGSSDTDGRIVQYEWDFGNGRGGRGSSIPYAYSTPGEYTVSLRVRDDSPSFSGTDTDSLQVIVNAAPVAEAGTGQVVTTSEVSFDGSASADDDGSIEQYRWDFGDGSSAEGASPVHVYTRPGVYRPRLTVVDDSGTPRNVSADELVVVVNARPVADAGPDHIAAPGQKLSFSGAESFDEDGEIVAFEWDFGDGATADGREAEHAFEAAGDYTVRLRIRDDTGDPRAVDFDEALVRVNARPVAKAGPDLLYAPGETIVFDGGRSFDPDGPIADFRWRFSDGEEAKGQRVERAFDEPGVYTAILTVLDGSGASNALHQDELTIRVNHPPQARLGPDIHSCDGRMELDGTLSADPDGDPLTYRWDFGDGEAGLGARAWHVYREGGSYPATLVVDDGTGLANGRSTASMVVAINRSPVADAGDDRTVCAGEVALFDGSGSSDPEGGLLRYHWDLGEGSTADGVNPTLIYKNGGTYAVTLTVEDDSGLVCDTDTDRISIRVAESPTADAGPDRTVCANSAVRFDGSGSRDFDGVVNRYLWDFGDTSRGGGSSPEHTYTEAATYRVRLTVTGDQVGDCDNTDTDEAEIQVLAAPAPRIDAPASVAVGRATIFDGSGSSGEGSEIVAWQWDFGDGTEGSGKTVEHAYESSGRYTMSLTIETAEETSCNRVTTRQVVIANQSPVANPGEDRVVGVFELVELDASGSTDEDGTIVDYQWDFGDGSTGEGLQVRHRYQKPGPYLLALTVTDDTDLENNRHTETVQVTVNAAPVPDIGLSEPPCANSPVTLSAGGSHDADGLITSWNWDFGDGRSASGEEVTHTWARPGLYHLTLQVDDGIGVVNSLKQASREVPVNQPPRPDAGPDRLVCPGEEIHFDGSGSVDPDGSITSYLWELGDGGEATGSTITYRFAEPGSYRVQLTATDDSASRCAAATDEAAVRVDSPPVVVTGGDRQAWVGGAHDALLFDASGSSDVDGDSFVVTWDFGDGDRASGARVFHAYRTPGTYTVMVTVDDGTGTACGTQTDSLVVEAKARP